MPAENNLPEVNESNFPACKYCSKPVKKEGDEFCCKGCKGLYNGRASKEFKNSVDQKISLNRNILEKLYKSKKAATKKALFDAGFDSEYYTKKFDGFIRTTKIYCYEYGVEFLEPGIRIFKVDTNKT
jgi:hypothetical protein